MKVNSLPFLFVVILNLFCTVMATQPAEAQTMKDSLRYYYDLYLNPQQATDLTNAYRFYQRHLQYNLNQRDTVGAINDLRSMASIQNNLGLLYDSEKTVVSALKILDQQQQKDTTNAALGLYNQLGMINNALYNFDKAINFYDKALAVSQNRKDSVSIFNNMAFTHSEQGNYKLARIEFERVYQNSIELNDSAKIARALDNLGSVKSKLKDPEGIQNMLDALKIRELTKDFKGLYASYSSLSEYYHAANDIDKATYYAKESYKIAKSINSVRYIEDALSNLITINKNPLVVEYKTIKDSIAKTKQLQENKFAEMQYNYSEYQRKAQESQLMASEQRSKTLMSQLIGVCILLMAIFLYIILRFRHKKENQLKVYETETRISKKVHDEVANDIYQMMTKLQTSKTTSEPLLDELEGIYFKTRDISKENSDIIHKDFKSQIEDLLWSYQNDQINVITKHLKEVDWSRISNAKKTTLYRVLQELMTNMKKHSKATLVVLSFQQKKRHLNIVYKDNGIGTDLHKGSGCINMENRMASIKGIITFESELGKGFKASLTV